MIVECAPRPGAPATALLEVKAIALRFPGEHDLVVRVGERRLHFAERVDVCAELVADLEDLDFTVGVSA